MKYISKYSRYLSCIAAESALINNIIINATQPTYRNALTRDNLMLNGQRRLQRRKANPHIYIYGFDYLPQSYTASRAKHEKKCRNNVVHAVLGFCLQWWSPTMSMIFWTNHRLAANQRLKMSKAPVCPCVPTRKVVPLSRDYWTLISEKLVQKSVAAGQMHFSILQSFFLAFVPLYCGAEVEVGW